MEESTNNGEKPNTATTDGNKASASSTHEYKMLGESGLYEDEEGNIYSASEIFGQDDTGEAADETKSSTGITCNSFISELDDKSNPAYWYFYYDPRFCGPCREAYMEKMARMYSRRNQQEKEKTASTSTTASASATTPVTTGPGSATPLADTGTTRKPSVIKEADMRNADRQQREAEREGLRPDYHSFSNGLRTCGMVNRQGEVIISYDEYTTIGHFHNGLARVLKKKTGLFGFVDIHGKEVISCKWRAAGEFSEYMAGVQDNYKKCGFIDVTGRLVIPCIWEDVWPFHAGLAKVQEHGKIGMIDLFGKRVIPCIWKGMGDFSEGLAGVQDEDGKCGYIDSTGTVTIPCQWKNVWTFSEGLAVVQDFNKKLGFINKSGELVIPCRWKKAEFFKNGLAKVTEGGRFFRKEKWVYIDKQGREVKLSE